MSISTERKAQDGIEGSTAAFVAGMREGDAAAAAAAYTDDARLVPPATEVVRGRAAIEAFWQAGLNAGIRVVEFHVLELERRGRVAVEIGSYALHLEPDDGRLVVDRGIYLRVHERQGDGSWRWAIEMFNPYASPAGAGTRQTEGGRDE